MHDHDLDLIAAHASGWLDEPDADRASRLVASCDTCAAEFASQQEIADLLSAAPPVTMTEFERARLHREVDKVVAPTAGDRRQTRWLRLVSVAAALVVVAGGVGVISQLPGGEDAGFDIAADGATASDESASDAEALVPTNQFERAEEESAPTDDADDVGETAMADAAGDDTGGTPPIAFIDVRGSGIETFETAVAELGALVAESSTEVEPDVAGDLGAMCVGDDPVLGILLGTFDGIDVEVVWTGDRAEPTIEAYEGSDCAAVVIEGITTGR